MSQDINQRWFQGIAVLRFCSARGKGLAGLKLLASLDAYQITKCQFFYKNSSFFVAWFPKNSREFANQESYGQLPEKAWSKGLFDFSKSCPSGHQSFQQIPKWKNVFIKMGLFPTVITNSFKILVVQKFENIFNHIFSFCAGFILFLEV